MTTMYLQAHATLPDQDTGDPVEWTSRRIAFSRGDLDAIRAEYHFDDPRAFEHVAHWAAWIATPQEVYDDGMATGLPGWTDQWTDEVRSDPPVTYTFHDRPDRDTLPWQEVSAMADNAEMEGEYQ